jgi:hypothetical protein
VLLCFQIRPPGNAWPSAESWRLWVYLGSSRLKRRLLHYITPSSAGPHKERSRHDGVLLSSQGHKLRLFQVIFFSCYVSCGTSHIYMRLLFSKLRYSCNCKLLQSSSSRDISFVAPRKTDTNWNNLLAETHFESGCLQLLVVFVTPVLNKAG